MYPALTASNLEWPDLASLVNIFIENLTKSGHFSLTSEGPVRVDQTKFGCRAGEMEEVFVQILTDFAVV